jgi:hypothetical protein
MKVVVQNETTIEKKTFKSNYFFQKKCNTHRHILQISMNIATMVAKLLVEGNVKKSKC